MASRESDQDFNARTLGVLKDALGDRETVIGLLNAFCSTTEGLVTKAEQAITLDDLDAVRKTAHSIKGSAGNVGVDAVFHAAERVETCAVSGDVPSAAEQVRLLRRKFDDCCNAIVAGAIPGLDD